MTELRPVDLIQIVPPLDLNQFGPLAEPWLVEACEHDGEWDLADLKAGLADGRFLLWVCWDSEKKGCVGAGVTRISINKRGEKIGHDVVFAGEDSSKLLPLLDRLEDFFRSQGCTRMRISGRKGWGRKLPHYRLAAVVLEKDLT
jgi:hypothetical protein